MSYAEVIKVQITPRYKEVKDICWCNKSSTEKKSREDRYVV
jgi:hypothetical protein